MNYELLPFIVLIAKIFRKKNKILFRNMNYISKSMASKKTLLSRIFLKYFMLFAFPFIDIVIHQCNEMKKDFDSYCFFHPNQSVVINNIVRTHQNKPITQVAQTPYILLVGRLVKQKNIKFAIDILKLCHKKNFKVDLIVIGEGELLDDLKRYSVRYGLSDYVKFLGNKNNVNDYYRSAHATILTSDYEGFPNVLIESMSCGTPVVAHNCKSGPEELIVNGKNGFLVNFQNDSEFVDAILKIKDIDRSDISSTITNYLVNNVYKHYSKIL
jgi:glycosyltransferase involved in cell wall biosynthesis